MKSKKKKYHQIGSTNPSNKKKRSRNANTLVDFMKQSSLEKERDDCLQELNNCKRENEELKNTNRTLYQDNLNLTSVNSEIEEKLTDLGNNITAILGNEGTEAEEKIRLLRLLEINPPPWWHWPRADQEHQGPMLAHTHLG